MLQAVRSTVALAGLLLVAAAPVAAGKPAPAPARAVVRVCNVNDWVTGAASGPIDRPGLPTVVSAKAVEDLVFEVRLPKKLPDKPVLTLTVSLPDGFTYQVLDVPIAEEGKAPASRALRGYPHALQERAVIVRGSDRVVEVSLPVGGTAISTNSLYGQWRVVATLDDGTACREASPFVITE